MCHGEGGKGNCPTAADNLAAAYQVVGSYDTHFSTVRMTVVTNSVFR